MLLYAVITCRVPRCGSMGSMGSMGSRMQRAPPLRGAGGVRAWAVSVARLQQSEGSSGRFDGLALELLGVLDLVRVHQRTSVLVGELLALGEVLGG